MNLQNTTNEEDRTILQARNNPLFDLIEIIERLDKVIEDWKEASGCDDPESLSLLMTEEEEEA